MTLADASQAGLSWREVPGYITAQLAGAFAGVGAANLTFGGCILIWVFVSLGALLFFPWASFSCSRLIPERILVARGYL